MINKNVILFSFLLSLSFGSVRSNCLDFIQNAISGLFFGKNSGILVDDSCKLSSSEDYYVSKRSRFVEDSLKKLVGKSEDYDGNLPKISFCFSGGGYRSMVASLGFVIGAKEIGLYDATTYISTLSGSTWFLGNFLTRLFLFGSDLNQFRETLQKRVKIGFWDTKTFDLNSIMDKVANLIAERREFEAADLWGIILADRLFGDIENHQDITFSKIRDLFFRDGTNEPFPLFSLSLSDFFPYEWLEVNPYYSGSDFLSCYIPTSAFDSKFQGGVCKKLFKERSLGWFFALFGSAYNISFGDLMIVLAKEANKKWFLDLVNLIVDKNNLHERRFLASPVNNFAYQKGTLGFSRRKKIELSDAGMSFNLPFPPLFREGRNSDIVFVCDSSSNTNKKGYPELHYAQAYMRRKGIKFPPLNKPIRIGNNITVFEDTSDRSVPMIIYCTNPTSVPTRILSYQKETFDKLCDSMKDVVVDNKQALIKFINRKV